MESTRPIRSPALDAFQHLTLAEVEQRLADVEAERESLMVLRKALTVRERSRKRTLKAMEGSHD